MLRETLAAISPLDETAMDQCRLRLDNLTKPLGSLHALEDLAVKLAGITRQPQPTGLKKSLVVITAAGDDGYALDGAVLAALAAHAGAVLTVVDGRTLFTGSGGRSHGALTREQVSQALERGLHLARTQLRRGSQALGIGVTGALTEAAAAVVAAEQQEPLAVLAHLGVPEMAVMTGFIVAAAAGRAAVVLDGAATAAAALLAVKLAPRAREYLIGSHYTREPVQQAALARLGVAAYLRLDMNLGGGAGAALGLTLLDAALHVLNDMKTFGEAAVAVAQDGPGALRQRPDII